MTTPINKQPPYRFIDVFWDTTDQSNMESILASYFKVAIGTKEPDKHGQEQYEYEEFNHASTDHMKAIFQRDFNYYCNNYEVSGKEYIPYFVDSAIPKWQIRFEAVRSPKFKEIIRLYIEYLKTQKAPEMAKSEAIRAKLQQMGHIGEVRPEVFFNIIQFQSLPGDAELIEWLTKKSNAMYFFKLIDLSISEANKCFRHETEKPFTAGDYPKRDNKHKAAFRDIEKILSE